MLATFGSIKPFIPIKPRPYSIDNFIFKLHYRWTFAILIISTILVSSRQYFGEHIKCISSAAVPARVIETFCFFTPTFTLVEHLNNTALKLGAIPHPGVGPLTYKNFYNEDPIKRHAYYQWVPFVLFGQAILFYFPHYLWKKWEGGKIKAFTDGLKNMIISQYVTKSLKINNKEFPSKDTTDERIQTIKLSFKNRLKIYKFWAMKFLFCEILNFINILLQIYLTNKFLGGQFYNLGIKVIKQNWKIELDILDIIFPKMTKCHFHKYGPSGSIQMHDALCVMALNIINEKIYTFLWFWFIMLLPISFFALIWRFIILMKYHNSSFSSMLFSYSSPGKFNKHHIEVVIQRCNFSDWMFLYFLGSNIDGNLFRDILEQLSDEFNDNTQYRDNTKVVVENITNQEDEKLMSNNQKTIDTVDSLLSIKISEDDKNK